MSDRMEHLYQTAVASGLIHSDAKESDRVEYPTIFVAPLGVAVPDDGMLTYVTVDKFQDLLQHPAGTVVLFREDQGRLLAVLCQDSDVFERDVHAVYGLPGTEYPRWFEEATFAKPRVSYAPLISEIRTAREIEQVRSAAAPKTVAQREDERILTKTGEVRSHDDDSIGIASE